MVQSGAMSSPDPTLIVGATGALGGHIARLLLGRGRAVRALVRPTAHAEKRRALALSGADLVTGDLKAPRSLAEACRGVKTVISTASATLSRQEGDSIHTVDADGQLALVAAAESAGVERFIFISFPTRPIDYALQRAKRAVEQRLQDGRMAFTSLQPVSFMETWLGPAVGFDLRRGEVRIFGAGDRPVAWIALPDVARAAANAANGGPFDRTVVPLCGPDPLTPLEVVAMFERMSGRPVKVSHVSEESIAARLVAARDPLEEAYAAILLSLARGLMPTRSEAERLCGPLSSVRDYLGRALGSGPAS
jgi:uncharacterized protein YbjT (DUF2867 family)